MRSQFDYIAYVNVYGIEKTFTAPSILALAKQLGVCHVTARKLVYQKGNCRTPATVVKQVKSSVQ